MSKFMLKFIFPFAILLLLVQISMAQQEITVGNDFYVGARAIGIGGAFTSVTDDFTALYWNPAGLSRIRNMQFYGSLSHEKQDTEITYFGEKESTFVSNTRPNSFGVVIPIPTYRGGLAFAFGMNRIQSYDSRIMTKGFNEFTLEEDPELGQLYIDEIIKESGGIYSWDFGAAVDVAPNVSVGASLGFLSGSYDYSLDLIATDTKGLDKNIDTINYIDTTATDYMGADAKVGVLARIAKAVKLGAMINIPLSFTANEYWTQDSYYTYDDGTEESDLNDGNVDYDISRPFRFTIGLSATPLPNALISADASYMDWTQTKYSEPPASDVSNEDFINDYRDTLRLSVGCEFFIPNSGLALRIGYMRDPLPYTPKGTEIETERQYITAGIGIIAEEAFNLDIAYMKGFYKLRTNSDKIKDYNSNRIFISAGFKF
ncbi:MAG: OmpP1/FadL family transporter [Candidatus Poribacteria bacterium]